MTDCLTNLAVSLSFVSAFAPLNSICTVFNNNAIIDYKLDFLGNVFELQNGIGTTSLSCIASAVNNLSNSDSPFYISENEAIDAELNENIRLLMELSSLEDDWDQCGASAIHKDIIESLLLLLPKLDQQPEMFPTPDGTIQLEYAIMPNKHLNIEILSGDTMTIFEMFADRSAVKETYELDYKLINSRVKAFNENI